MLRLERLKVKGVRGIVDGPDLMFEAGGLLLCGDNGTGKSSYIDSLEKVITDHCGQLEGRGRNLSWRKQGSHINCDESQIELILTDGNRKHTISLDTVNHRLDEQINRFVTAAQYQSFVLRRRTLLDFIDNIPSKRYEQIQRYLKLDGYQELEKQLRERLRKVKQTHQALEAKIQSFHYSLRSNLGIAPDVVLTDTTYIKQLNQFMVNANVDAIESLSSVSSHFEVIDRQKSILGNAELVKTVHNIENTLESFPAFPEIRSALDVFWDCYERYVQERSRIKGRFYVEVMEQGLSWIEDDNLTICPLCNNPIELEQVKEFVTERVASHKQLRIYTNDLVDAKTKLGKLLPVSECIKLRDIWCDVFDEVFPDRANEIVNQVVRIHDYYSTYSPNTGVDINRIELTQVMYDELFDAVRDALEGIKADSLDVTLYDALIEAERVLIVFVKEYTRAEKAQNQLKHLEKCESQIDVLLGLVEQARKSTIQLVLDTVVETANRLFQRIHESENIGKPRLQISETSRGSIDLFSMFHSEIDDPRGHYSEGHIDSLALCLFLAIRRIQYVQNPDFAVLVLDDVMHSVDANHRRETAKMIIDEFDDHQLIITTHDPMWFEYLKTATNRSRNKFAIRRISSWSLETGPVWGDHLAAHEWLISDSGIRAQPQDMVVKAGVLLEEMLQNLCSNLDIPVPYRIQGDYTIGPLWNGFYKVAKTYKGFLSVAEQCMREIEDLRSLRNWGAHWVDWARGLTVEEARGFTNAVLELRDHVYCTNCQQYIYRISGLTGVWSCSSECIRYNKSEIRSSSIHNLDVVTWKDLEEINIPKGPMVGRIISMIREKVNSGVISTKQQALEFAKEIRDGYQ